ncbi:DEAD/DEAH box helicase [Dactylosporangium siamense]|uniref:DEAD/DEAH box helicase n=1 Tax=Dactylosporangium siamense TaxID=685454 RepID=UPI001944A578|nr:DEAD/DEAH box helicase [Dactylosporangium siamense]
MQSLERLQGYLDDAFLRYYETAYELREDAISQERRALLRTTGTVFAEPFLELMPSYPDSTLTLEEIFDGLGVPEGAGLVVSGLLPRRHPWSHQEEALRLSMAGNDVIVGTGTGSGKTESFLLPVLAQLVQESRQWTAQTSSATANTHGWWRAQGPFRAQRDGETGRLPGIRAMLLYPMNALVEDQMVRLRAALDSSPARAWFAANRPGHRFYFGRYTGRSPLPGTMQTASADKVERLRQLMRSAEQRHSRLLNDISVGKTKEGARFFLPAMDGAEMRSRWDMQQAAPDILITNYSMLSIALSRDDEAPMIAATRRWLEASTSHVFTLVVDELHMYRGTAGTEVAYLLRRLMMALGLDCRPQQLRVIGTSASIQDDGEGRAFLSEFFARPASTAVRFVHAPPSTPSGADDLSHLAHDLQTENLSPSMLPQDGTLRRAFMLALTGADGFRPRSVGIVAGKLFPNLPAEQGRHALDALTVLVGRQPEPPVRLRGHMFIRTLQGMWACCDPACARLDPQYSSPTRKIGKLYTTPRFACDCGARVLELLYCQSCGECMLGGYVARSGTREFLVSTIASLDELPDRVIGGRNPAGYRMYWPTDRVPVVANPWSRTGTKLPTDATAPQYRMKFAKAVLRPGTGQLTTGGRQQPTGYVYHLATSTSGAENRMPAMPTQCPSCGDDWEWIQKGKVEEAARSRSSIRTQGVGFDRANQVLTGALKRRLDSRLVVFSDSRQGAARVSANLELAHYLDLVRALVIATLTEMSADGALLDKLLHHGDRSPEALAAVVRLRSVNEAAAMAVYKRMAGAPTDDGDNDAIQAGLAAIGGKPSLIDFVNQVEPRLLALGVNPGGPAPSLQQTKASTRWTQLFTWTTSPVRDRASLVDSDGRALLQAIRDKLSEQVVRTVFAGGDRDVESIGVAHATAAAPVTLPSLTPEAAYEFTCSVLRLLGRKRRLPWTSDQVANWPRVVREYAEAVAVHNKCDRNGDGLLAALGERVGVGPGSGFRVAPSQVCLTQVDGAQFWRCGVCRTKHLHRSAGVCVTCAGRLVDTPTDVGPIANDYYAWLATEDGGAYRMHCEELTGQTDPLEGQKRQARFQAVFIDDDEEELVDEIDILSVTTTMEAGVDVGALRGVVMANMPPQRFNYQQRVGRAGRRSEHLAVALTVCRGARSHDEHYFANPSAITGDVPPQPFLDMRSVPILRRAFAAEVLTRVFRAAARDLPGFVGGRSVHGQFGAVVDLIDDVDLRSYVAKALTNGHDEWSRIAQALLTATKMVDLDAAALTLWAVTDLADKVLAVAAAAAARVPDLSEALAQAGVLPMFGFPTQVRLLYTKHPQPWQEANTLDRDADIAISEFAPGTELVKDKAVHTAVGVVDYVQLHSGTWVEGPDPLGPRSRAGLCRACLSVTYRDVDVCPNCSRGTPDFTQVELAEPVGYRTSYRSRDYEQLGEPTAAAAQPRLSMEAIDEQPRDGNALIRSAVGEILAVNDNYGRLFAFTQAARVYKGSSLPAPGLIEADILTDNIRQERAGLWGHTPAGSAAGALAIAARRRTDVLVVGLRDIEPGLQLSPVTPSGRGAWASLGYLLRDTAAKWLDIGPNEIEIGVHPRLRSDILVGEVFIADSLENGAGYASRLAEKFEVLLDEADEHTERLRHHNVEPCDSSCHACLRDYGNRAWHPLLDWRLAIDLLDLLRGRQLDVNRQEQRDIIAARSFAKDFKFTVSTEAGVPVIAGRPDRHLAVFHPFENLAVGSTSPRVASVRAAYPNVLCTSSFELLRRPGLLVGDLMAP